MPYINYLKYIFFLGSVFVMLNPVVASAGYKDWSKAKQAGYVVEKIDMCQEYVGTFRHDDIIKQSSAINKYYRGSTQFKDGVHRADISGYDTCSNCSAQCEEYKDTYLRLLNNHFSFINSTSTSVKTIDTTKSSGTYKPTTNFTSSDTKTSVTSNTDKRSIPFAAHWEAKSGVLLGVLNYPKAGDAGSLSASSGDISCQGTWQRAGQGAENGTWSIACSDGRTASGFYKMHEVGKGTGTGTDPDGNKVEVTWGG